MSSGRTNCVINLGKEEQSKSITITSNGTTTIIPDEGKVLNSVSINTKVPVKQEQVKSITITTNGTNTLTPDSGKLFSKVDITTAVPIPETQTKSVNITTNGTTTITPDSGKVLSSVEVTTNISGTNTLKKLLDSTKSTDALFIGYDGNSVEDLIKFDDTENVITMDSMFASCANLTTIPALNTTKVTVMSYMFAECNNLTTIPTLNVSNVTNMASMFYSCSSLTTIPLLDTSKIINMNNMFAECINLTTIPALDISNVDSKDSLVDIFAGCSNLKSILMTGMKVSFNISASTKFEQADLVTILNNLATVTTTQTLTMGATNLAKLTDADKKIATDKGWTLA